MENRSEKSLQINCGLACLLNDREGILDAYEMIHINCGIIIVSPGIHAKLSAKRMQIYSTEMRIREVKGKIVQLDAGATIDGTIDFKDMFVIAAGDLIVRGEGSKRLGEAEGIVVPGTLYYPDSTDPPRLETVIGNTHSYPDGAYPLLGSYELGKAIAAAPDGRYIWVSGEISAPDRKALEDARARGLKIACGSLLTYEDFNASFGDLFTCSDRVLAPEGYVITGSLESAKLPLYGPKVFVNGDFTMKAGDLPLLENVESIIVKGMAELPAAAAETFRGKGRAGEYRIIKDRNHKINGFERYNHGLLTEFIAAGEKLNLEVYGFLLFDKDVTVDDLACIASLSYYGTVLVPAKIRAALMPKIRGAYGFMGDPGKIDSIPGNIFHGFNKIFGDFFGNSFDVDNNSSSINTDTYLLI
jgi:hypothetical protein